MPNPIVEFAKKIAFRHLGLGAPTYRYGLEPIQLAAIVGAIEDRKNIPGSIVEIGVARGMTTRFIAEHISRQGYDRRIYAIDTFGSFRPEHVEYEIDTRGKSRRDLKAFGYNDFEIWKRNFAALPFVAPIAADAAIFDFKSIGPIVLAVLDVDLYLPTKAALASLYGALAPGGIIFVDDCKAGTQWDGALQAYQEFIAEVGLTPEFIGSKCGVIRKA